MFLKDLPNEFFGFNADGVKLDEIEKFIAINLSQDIINNIMKTPFTVLNGTFGMGKTTILRYIEKKIIDEFEENRLIPIFLQFTIQTFHEIIRYNISDEIRIRYFTRSIFLTIVKQIKSILKERNYRIFQEKIKNKELRKALELIQEFLDKSSKDLKEVQETINKSSPKLELDAKFLRVNKGTSDRESVNRYTIIPTSIFDEFKDLIKILLEYLDIEKFIFLFDESFAIYRNYGLELYALFLTLMKAMKSSLADCIELKLSILPYPKPPTNTYFRIGEDFYEYTIQYVNFYNDDQDKILNFFKNLFYIRYKFFKDNIKIENLPNTPNELINQIFNDDAWLAIVYASMGVPRHFFLLLKKIREKGLKRKIFIDDVEEAMFSLANTLEDAIETKTNKETLKDIRQDLEKINKSRALPNYIFTIFIAYPKELRYIGLIEELVRNNLLVLYQDRITFDTSEIREKLGGENYGLLFSLHLCYGYREKLFRGPGGGSIKLKSLTTYFKYLNSHASSKEYRSRIHDFIPGQEIIDEEEIIWNIREDQKTFIQKAEVSLDEFLTDKEEIPLPEISIKPINEEISTGSSLPPGYKTDYEIIKKIVFDNGVYNKLLIELQSMLRYRNGQMTKDKESALKNLISLYKNECDLFWALWTKGELQSIASHMNLPKYGNKNEISLRIIGHLKKQLKNK